MAFGEAGVVFEGDVLFVLAPELGNDGEGADFHQRIAQQIKEDGGIGGDGAVGGRVAGGHAGDGGEGYQDVAGMGDGAVSQEALDVGLDEGAEVADKHGERGEDPEGPEPVLGGSGYGGEDAQEQGESSGFGS